MRLSIGGTEIRINITAVIMPAFMLVAGLMTEYAAAFFSMLMHELSHLAAARICGIRSCAFSISILGFSADIQDGSCSRRERLFIYAAGPVFNLLVFSAAAVSGRILPGDQEFLRLLSAANLILALFNLLPVLPLDGGRFVLGLLAEGTGLMAAGRILHRLALFFSVSIIFIGAYQLYISSFNISLIVIGLYIMTTSITGRMESALMNIRQIVYRRSRLIKKGVYPARDLVVMKSVKLGDSLKSMDFDRFHIVYVLDDDLHILGLLTESEIMDALAANCDDITFGQLLYARLADAQASARK